MARSMGGGGRSGGGRSMGGGSRSGSRSFSGSGRTRISSGGHRSMGSSGYSRPHYNTSHHHHYYHHYGGRYYHSSPGGCSSILASIIVIIILLSFFAISGLKGGGTNQKLNREKYNGSVDSSNGYYIDNSEGDSKFIDRSNETTLISGFKQFYNKTGVFPFLYIVEHTPDKSMYEGYDTYQDMLYETLFKSEGNLLILYIADNEDYYFAAGYDTGEIIDDVSIDVICDKVNGYWHTGDLAKAFGNGLADASKNIMAKSNFRVIMITIIVALAVILLAIILFKWWKAKTAQKNKEQEDLERTLNTPLETFGDSPMDDLTKKYDDPE